MADEDEVMVSFSRVGNVVVRRVESTVPEPNWEVNEDSPEGFLPIGADKELNTAHGSADSQT